MTLDWKDLLAISGSVAPLAGMVVAGCWKLIARMRSNDLAHLTSMQETQGKTIDRIEESVTEVRKDLVKHLQWHSEHHTK